MLDWLPSFLRPELSAPGDITASSVESEEAA